MLNLSVGAMENSISMPGESTALFDEYQRFAKEYDHPSQRYQSIFWKESTTGKPNPRIGWKIHLNVSPENALKVIKFLIENDLEHKYLSGADLNDGKIFTVYLGPKSNLLTWATTLNKELGSMLLPVKSQSDIPILNNITGRFVGEKSIYNTKSSLRGITLLEEWKSMLDQVNDKQELQKRGFEATDADLLRRYGKYYGGNDFPQTEISQTNSFEQLWDSTFKQ